VLDFGGQYSHLHLLHLSFSAAMHRPGCIYRIPNFYLLIYLPIEELKGGTSGKGKVRGIIVSGSPFSVHEPASPGCSPDIFALNIPILGICYGAQLIVGYTKNSPIAAFRIPLNPYRSKSKSKSLTICAYCIQFHPEVYHTDNGDKLTCIFIDNGLLRAGEAEGVLNTFRDRLKLRVAFVDARARFLNALRGITDAEAKRKVIGVLVRDI